MYVNIKICAIACVTFCFTLCYANEVRSVSGVYVFNSKIFESSAKNSGQVNSYTFGVGNFVRIKLGEIYWEYIPVRKDSNQIQSMISSHDFPAWINLPDWDKGRIETWVRSETRVIRAGRTNGAVCEFVFAANIFDGILCAHIIFDNKEGLQTADDIFWNFISDVKLNGISKMNSVNLAEGGGNNIQKHGVPIDYNSAIIELIYIMSDREKIKLKSMSDSHVFDFYEFVLPQGTTPTGGVLWGKYIALYWGLVDGGSPLAIELCSRGLSDPERQAAAIILGAKYYLLNKKFDLETIAQIINLL